MLKGILGHPLTVERNPKVFSKIIGSKKTKLNTKLLPDLKVYISREVDSCFITVNFMA
jgi:hypothetical protein